jgi:hypothetical protein
MHRAKRSNFDAGCGIDIQFLCGGGYSETKAFLATCTVPEPKEALDYLVECETDFLVWNPVEHLLRWKRYYRLV